MIYEKFVQAWKNKDIEAYLDGYGKFRRATLYI